MKKNMSLRAFIVALATLLTGFNLNGQEVQSFSKEFIFKNSDGKENKDLEPSAIEAINERYLLIADDKRPELLIVETTSGKIIRSLTIPGLAISKPKWEAMAFDGEFFYVIGSHAVKIDDTSDKLTKKLAARSHFFRFRLKNIGDDASTIEIDSVAEIDVTDSLSKLGLYDTNPNNNKVKIEGLAVRTDAEGKVQLLFALREPHDFMWVYSADLPKALVSHDKLLLKPNFSFGSGKIGKAPFKLSSIEYAPTLDGFLIVTSTEDDVTNAFYGNALWFVKNDTLKNSQLTKPIAPQIVWLFDVGMKGEGLCILPNATNHKINLALVFDNDAEDTRKPGMMRFITLVSNSE